MTRPSARTLPDGSDTYLERARVALAKQDFAAARDLLITAWRSRRLPEIADLVDLVAARAPDALTEQLATVITPRVATTLRNWQVVGELDDPRVSRFAIDALLKLPFQGPSARSLLHAFVEVIDARKDARIVESTRAILAGIATRVTPLAAREELAEAVRITVEMRDDMPDATSEEDALLQTLATLVEPLRSTTRSADALLADVHANPEDDAPRLVLADLLMERGDPRGEFIALQIERARAGTDESSEREVQLLKKHGKQWLGNLAPVLSWGKGYARTTFRRGFVAKADIILSVGKKLEPIKRDPAWATVEELDGVSWPTDLLWTAPLRGLRHVERRLSSADLAQLARRPLVGVRSVRFDFATPVDAAALRTAFPKLERLLVYRAPQAKQLELLEPYGCSVETTHNWLQSELRAARAELDAYVESLVGTKAPIARLVLAAPTGRGDPAEKIELRRDAHGRFERV